MRDPVVSVVIPTHNFGHFVAEAIGSVLNQTVAIAEIIVVDDGSTDDTHEVVGRFGQKVRYIVQANAGVCAARNRGVSLSRGSHIAFLDADDTWEPTKIEKQLVKFSEDAEIGLVHCGLREFDDATGETIALRVEGQEGWLADELLLWARPVIAGPGGTIIVSRAAFDTVGGFDTRMKVGEDWDFCYRVARKYKVGFVPEPLVNYRRHAASAHRNVAEMERGMALFYEKAFAEGGDVLKLKRRALGSFHRILAGSYLHSGEYASFLRHTALSLVKAPSNLKYFLAFPKRRRARTRNG